MKIIGFPVDVSRSQDGRVVRGLRTRQSLIQATLDLIQAGDVEPTSAAIATIAGVSSRALFQHFTSLADLYAAAFDLAVSRAFDRTRPVDSGAPLSNRIDLLVSDRSELFEEWLPVWHFAERVRSVAPAVGLGVTQLRKLLRERLAAWFATELGNLEPASHDLVLEFARSRFRARQLDEHARAASTVAGPCVAHLALHGRGDRPAGAHRSDTARGGGLTATTAKLSTEGFAASPAHHRSFQAPAFLALAHEKGDGIPSPSFVRRSGSLSWPWRETCRGRRRTPCPCRRTPP